MTKHLRSSAHSPTRPRPWSATTLFATLALVFTALSSQAASITVKKVKGNSAVIEMSTPLEVGKTYNLETDALTLTADYSTQFKSRYNSISLGLDVNMMNGNKVTDNAAAFNMRYGWNHRSFEFGPVLNVEFYDKGFGANTNYLLGGYFDYNWLDNKAGRDFVYGPTAQVLLGNRNFDTGGSAQVTQAAFGGFMTWFINSSPVALRTEALYVHRRVNTSAAETTLSGVDAQIYLMYYY